MKFRSEGLKLNLKLDENTPLEDIPKRVQLMRECTFYHQTYGKVEITEQLFNEMIKNFESNTRGIDVMIDYAHESDKEAAGWVKNLEIVLNEETNESELWAIVEWTPKGRKTLSDKEYGYLSADFNPDYRDNENPDLKFGAVLLGAGLTNRPVIKKMNSTVQLSEYKENQMDNEKLIELTKTNVTLQEENGVMVDKLAKIDAFMKEMGVDSLEGLMKLISELRSDNTSMQEKQEMADKETQLSELFTDGKINTKQKDEAIKLSGENFKTFVTLAEMNTPIKLKEEGHSEEKNTEDKDVELVIQEKATKLAEEKKISLGNAISLVLSENKELREKYNNK